MARIIEQLLELHRIDQELGDVARESERLPAEVAAWEEKLAELEGEKAVILEENRGKRVAAEEADLKIKGLEEQLARYQVQLNITKTQKEYDAIRHEITACQEQVSETETGALTAYEEADQLAARAAGLDPGMEELEKSLEAARAELDDRLADLAHRREKLLRERGKCTGDIDGDDLKLYGLVLSKHPEGAMTRVENGTCTLCNISLTPQTYNLVLMGEKIQQCRSCGRICYSQDAPGGG